MRIVLGIGNPGREYERTRHNIGFLVVDELARRHAPGAWQSRWKSDVADWRLPAGFGAERALLIKPRTYVNLSGEAAQAALAFHKLPPSELLVVVDDINLPLGTLRLRDAGSAGGHNGLRDIEARLGQAYPRLRLGVGAPRPGADQIGHVLGGFAPDEQADAEAMVRKAADCVEAWLREGVTVACAYNGPLRPPPPKPKPAAPPRDAPPT
jgi:PTH1 family peptidyl-tRNA hydrolase